MATQKRWMDFGELLATHRASHGDALREAETLLVAAEETIDKAARVLFSVAMELNSRRLAGAALSADAPEELRDVLKSLLLKLQIGERYSPSSKSLTRESSSHVSLS